MPRKDYNPKVGGTYTLDNPMSQFNGHDVKVGSLTQHGFFNVTLTKPVGGTLHFVAFKHELAPLVK